MILKLAVKFPYFGIRTYPVIRTTLLLLHPPTSAGLGEAGAWGLSLGSPVPALPAPAATLKLRFDYP